MFHDKQQGFLNACFLSWKKIFSPMTRVTSAHNPKCSMFNGRFGFSAQINTCNFTHLPHWNSWKLRTKHNGRQDSSFQTYIFLKKTHHISCAASSASIKALLYRSEFVSSTLPNIIGAEKVNNLLLITLISMERQKKSEKPNLLDWWLHYYLLVFYLESYRWMCLLF